jgi:hypothetical protein
MSVLLMILGRRRPGQTLADHRQHMRAVHGRLVLEYIAEAPELAPDEALMVDASSVIGTPFAMTEINEAPEVSTAPMHKGFAVFAATSDQNALRESLAQHVAQAGLAEQARLRRQQALVPGKLDMVDTFWLPDAAAARALAQSYKAEVIDPMIAAGDIPASGAALVLAQEIPLHATF